jgi:hypothetical protein
MRFAGMAVPGRVKLPARSIRLIIPFSIPIFHNLFVIWAVKLCGDQN